MPNDEIEQMIINDGYIDNNHLWRKWIMIQILREYSMADTEKFYDNFLNSKSYAYTWDSAMDEIYALSRLNSTELETRSQFFNADVIEEMVNRYAKDVMRHISSHVAMCGYAKLPDKALTIYESNKERNKRTMSLDAFSKRIKQHVNTITSICNDITANKKSYTHLYAALTKFMNECSVAFDFQKSPLWVNAYTGAGAYYTMDNLIKFHCCKLNNKNTTDSLIELNECVSKYKANYADLFDMMLNFFEDNQSEIKIILRQNL